MKILSLIIIVVLSVSCTKKTDNIVIKDIEKNNIEYEENNNINMNNEIIIHDDYKETIETNNLIAGKGFKSDLGSTYEEYYFVDNNYLLVYCNSQSLSRPIFVKVEYQYFEDGTIILSNIDYIYRSPLDSESWNWTVETSMLSRIGNINSLYDMSLDDSISSFDFTEVPILSYDDIKELYRENYGIQIREKM
jgi:hypothetical protein